MSFCSGKYLNSITHEILVLIEFARIYRGGSRVSGKGVQMYIRKGGRFADFNYFS